MERESSGLIYVGDGSAWVMGTVLVPTRDLTADEVERFGGEEMLVGSGLYEKMKVKEVHSRDATASRRCTSEGATHREELEDVN